MDKRQLLISTALGGLMTLSTAGAAQAAQPQMQKCYGINKAHMNDCKSADHGCKGMASKSRDPDSFVYLPKGVCQKIAGSSLTPGGGSGKGSGSGSSGGGMNGGMGGGM